MKILYVSQWFSSSGGGGEVLFMEIANGIIKRGHYVHVVSHALDDFQDHESDHIKIHRINPLLRSFPPSYIQNIKFILNATWLGLKIIKREKIDIIHVNNFSPVIVGTILSKICNIPLVKTIHVVFSASPNYWKNWAKQSNVSRLTSIIGPLFEKLTIRLPADIIHTVSDSTKKDLIKYKAKSKIVVIPNIVNLSFYDKLKLNKSYEDYVLFVGRLAFNKNLNVVISSFAKVVEKVPSAKLIIVGTGPMLDEWKKIVFNLGLKENVVFTGYISQHEKMELWSKSAALILPSITEGLPTVVLESFAMSTPVIVSDIDPHREIIDDGLDGFLIPLNDSQKWAEKIIYLLSNKDICKKMGEEGRIKVEREFSVESIIRKIESLYSTLVH